MRQAVDVTLPLDLAADDLARILLLLDSSICNLQSVIINRRFNIPSPLNGKGEGDEGRPDLSVFIGVHLWLLDLELI